MSIPPIIQTRCTLCGRKTDWWENSDKPPVCLRHWDEGKTGEKSTFWTEAKVREACRLREGGATTAGVARQLKCSQRTVQRLLSMGGMNRRTE